FAKPAYGIFNNIFRDVFWCIENPVLFSLALLLVKFSSFNFGMYAFYFVERIFKDMAKDIHVYLAFKIISCQPGGVFVKEIIVYLDGIQDRIGLEEATVIGKNFSFFVGSLSSGVQVAEVELETFV